MPLDIRNMEDSAFISNSDVISKSPNIIPTPTVEIGVDTNNKIYQDIISAAISNTLDISALDSFLSSSRNRDQVYKLIDSMGYDSVVSAVLKAYASNATEVNENGDIIWADSNDPDIKNFVTSVLKSMRVNKHAFGWIHDICKYGDLYLRMYRESEFNDDVLADDLEKKGNRQLNEDFTNINTLANPELEETSKIDINEELESLKNKDKTILNEDVKVKVYSKEDHYVNYLEAMPNPAEMFELTKFGKSYAYIKANVPINQTMNTQDSFFGANLDFIKYSFKKSDVTLYQATEFVHGYLEDSSNRQPEEVKLTNTTEDGKEISSTYKVRRGQSLLSGAFRAWRELQLLENAIMLNRITKSSLVRVITVEVGDMPKEMVGPHLQGVKSLMEQKQSLVAGQNGGLGEYTNPGPVENNIYLPTRNGQGAIGLEQVGGEYQAGQLTDLEYFRDKFFGSLSIPKQYFGFTDDGAGFSGGESLSIISAEFAKDVVRIQNTLIQALTDAVNLICLDRGLKNYINKFSIKMVAPVTKNDLDRRDNISAKVTQTSDIMSLLSDIDNPILKLEMLKNLMSSYITDPDIISLLQEEIDRLTREKEEAENPPEQENVEVESIEDEDDISLGLDLDTDSESEEIEDSSSEVEEIESGSEEDTILPTPEDLGLDFTDSDNEEFQ